MLKFIFFAALFANFSSLTANAFDDLDPGTKKKVTIRPTLFGKLKIVEDSVGDDVLVFEVSQNKTYFVIGDGGKILANFEQMIGTDIFIKDYKKNEKQSSASESASDRVPERVIDLTEAKIVPDNEGTTALLKTLERPKGSICVSLTPADSNRATLWWNVGLEDPSILSKVRLKSRGGQTADGFQQTIKALCSRSHENAKDGWNALMQGNRIVCFLGENIFVEGNASDELQIYLDEFRVTNLATQGPTPKLLIASRRGESELRELEKANYIHEEPSKGDVVASSKGYVGKPSPASPATMSSYDTKGGHFDSEGYLRAVKERSDRAFDQSLSNKTYYQIKAEKREERKKREGGKK